MWWRDQDQSPAGEAADEQVLTRMLDKVGDLLAFVNSSLTRRRTALLERTQGAASPHMATATNALDNAVKLLHDGMRAFDHAVGGLREAVPSAADLRRIRKQEQDWMTRLSASAQRAAARANTADQTENPSGSANIGRVGWYVSRNVLALEGTAWLLYDAEHILRDLQSELHRPDHPGEADHSRPAFVCALAEAADKLNGCRTSTSVAENEVRVWMEALAIPMSQYPNDRDTP